MFFYALTTVVSAFLLFQVEPVIAKIILPWFGGSAAVWTVCLLFFQVVLLLSLIHISLPLTVMAVEPLPETVVELAFTDNQLLAGDAVGVKVNPVPMLSWMVTVCDGWLLEIAMLPGVTLKNPLVTDPVFPPQLVFCV